jgi:hypothetical protein
MFIRWPELAAVMTIFLSPGVATLHAAETSVATGLQRQFPGGVDEDDLQVQKNPLPPWNRFNLRVVQDQEIRGEKPDDRKPNAEGLEEELPTEGSETDAPDTPE